MWNALSDSGAARLPLPTGGCIPNFAGAREAAERLLAHSLFSNARRIKVNPDAPSVSYGTADRISLPSMTEHILNICPTATGSWYEGFSPSPCSPSGFRR